jgi:hypothetical protein
LGLLSTHLIGWQHFHLVKGGIHEWGPAEIGRVRKLEDGSFEVEGLVSIPRGHLSTDIMFRYYVVCGDTQWEEFIYNQQNNMRTLYVIPNDIKLIQPLSSTKQDRRLFYTCIQLFLNQHVTALPLSAAWSGYQTCDSVETFILLLLSYQFNNS